MRRLSKRETVLAVMVGVASAILGMGLLNRHFADAAGALDAELARAKESLKSSRALLEAPSKEPVREPTSTAGVSEAVNRLTLTLLKDLTAPEEVSPIRVVGLERVGEESFKLSIE